eukprot:RCo002376
MPGEFSQRFSRRQTQMMVACLLYWSVVWLYCTYQCFRSSGVQAMIFRRILPSAEPKKTGPVTEEEVLRWAARLCPNASTEHRVPADIPRSAVLPEGIYSDREICLIRIRRLLEDFRYYPSISKKAAELAYKNLVGKRGLQGRYARVGLSCDGVRIQIIRGHIYWELMPPGLQMNGSVRSMLIQAEGTLAFLTKTVAHFGTRVPDVDFVVMFGDTPPLFGESLRQDDVDIEAGKGHWLRAIQVQREPRAPMFSYASRDGATSIAAPTLDWQWGAQDFTEGSPWRTDASPTLPWISKQPLAVWRGTPSSWVRVRVCELSLKHPELIDARLAEGGVRDICRMGFVDMNHKHCQSMTSKPMSTPVLTSHKYLLDVDGAGASFRYKNLLLSRSLVIKVQEEMHQFFDGDLKPWVHYIPVMLKDLDKELPRVVRWARANDSMAQKIALTSAAYVKEHLKEEDAMWYQWASLMIYASRQTFRVTRSPGARRWCCLFSGYYRDPRKCVELCPAEAFQGPNPEPIPLWAELAWAEKQIRNLRGYNSDTSAGKAPAVQAATAAAGAQTPVAPSKLSSLRN